MPVLFALATVLSTTLGGLLALREHDRRHLVLGFTAGVLLGLVAFDLLPEVFSLAGDRTAARVPLVMLAFAAGFLLLHVLERSLALHEGQDSGYGEHHHPSLGLLSALALAAHSFVDGLGIGLAFQVDRRIGLAVALAVIAHDFADGLNTVNLMLLHRNTRRRAKILLAVDALAPLAGAAATLFFSVSDGVLALYLGFFAGFLLYLATADILPEAHSARPSRLTLVSTLGGMGMIFAVVAVS